MEVRQEQDEIVKNLQQQVIRLEQIINQTSEIDNVQSLDQAYEVNSFSKLPFSHSTFVFTGNQYTY